MIQLLRSTTHKLFLLTLLCIGGVSKVVAGEGSDIRVVPMRRAQESNTAALKLIFPQQYENKKKTPVNVQLRVEGFPLGIKTPGEHSSKFINSTDGQSIHVVIDNHPYIAYNQSFEDSFDENREFYDKILSFPIPFTLDRGQHVIRCFPAFSYGESLKGKGCFQSRVFYYQDQAKSKAINFDPDKPFLTYNEPQGHYSVKKTGPVLLDFYITNCQLSEDGYKVRFSVNNHIIQELTEWVPYAIYGLKKGTHKIKLELLDSNGKNVPGYFNITERQIFLD